MNALIVGVYGLYLILVGMNGNAGQLAGKVQADAPKFLPWIIAIFVLAFVHGSGESGRKVSGPFILLLILTFVLKRFDTLQSQTTQLWDMASKAQGSNANSSISSGDKVAPAGTVNQSSSMPLGGSSTVNDAIKSLNSSSSSSSSNGTGNIQNASDAMFALENLLG